MKLYNRTEDIQKPFVHAVITIGNFDGVHIGHQALLHAVMEKADAIDGTSVALTFEPHPMRVLNKNGHLPLITLFEQKSELIASTGIDALVCIPFTSEFAGLTARQFVADLLVKRLGMKAIVVGEDYSFGRNREGNLEMLQQLGRELDFEVIVHNWIPISGRQRERISSTRIRQLVSDGHVDQVHSMLGRYYQVRGTVMHGRNRGGRLLGIPTANLHLVDELCPKTGVYAVTVETGKERWKGVANIGYSPTFDDYLFTVEVHILGYSGDLYDQSIRVNFVQRIRDEIRFESIDALAAQIHTDIRDAEALLSL